MGKRKKGIIEDCCNVINLLLKDKKFEYFEGKILKTWKRWYHWAF